MMKKIPFRFNRNKEKKAEQQAAAAPAIGKAPSPKAAAPRQQQAPVSLQSSWGLFAKARMTLFVRDLT
jgi:hypothetical protein